MVDLSVNGLVHTKRGQHWPSHHGQSRHHQGCPEHHRSSMQRRRRLGRRLPKTRMQRGSTRSPQTTLPRHQPIQRARLGRRLPKTRMQRGSTHGCSLTKTRTQRGSTRSPLMQNLTPIYFWVDCLAKDFVLNKQNRSRNRRRLKRDQKEEQKQSRNTSRNRSRKRGQDRSTSSSAELPLELALRRGSEVASALVPILVTTKKSHYKRTSILVTTKDKEKKKVVAKNVAPVSRTISVVATAWRW